MSSRLSGVIASLASGFGYMVDSGEVADKDKYFSIENLDGGLANDFLYGNEINNRLRGNNGVDQLFGYGGDDVSPVAMTTTTSPVKTARTPSRAMPAMTGLIAARTPMS